MDKNDRAIVKNETNLSLEEVLTEINIKRSKYMTKEEFLTMITNLEFDSISVANLYLVTGYKCIYDGDEHDQIKVETLDKVIRINNNY